MQKLAWVLFIPQWYALLHLWLGVVRAPAYNGNLQSRGVSAENSRFQRGGETTPVSTKLKDYKGLESILAVPTICPNLREILHQREFEAVPAGGTQKSVLSGAFLAPGAVRPLFLRGLCPLKPPRRRAPAT